MHSEVVLRFFCPPFYGTSQWPIFPDQSLSGFPLQSWRWASSFFSSVFTGPTIIFSSPFLFFEFFSLFGKLWGHLPQSVTLSRIGWIFYPMIFGGGSWRLSFFFFLSEWCPGSLSLYIADLPYRAGNGEVVFFSFSRGVLSSLVIFFYILPRPALPFSLRQSDNLTRSFISVWITSFFAIFWTLLSLTLKRSSLLDLWTPFSDRRLSFFFLSGIAPFPWKLEIPVCVYVGRISLILGTHVLEDALLLLLPWLVLYHPSLMGVWPYFLGFFFHILATKSFYWLAISLLSFSLSLIWLKAISHVCFILYFRLSLPLLCWNLSISSLLRSFIVFLLSVQLNFTWFFLACGVFLISWFALCPIMFYFVGLEDLSNVHGDPRTPVFFCKTSWLYEPPHFPLSVISFFLGTSFRAPVAQISIEGLLVFPLLTPLLLDDAEFGVVSYASVFFSRSLPSWAPFFFFWIPPLNFIRQPLIFFLLLKILREWLSPKKIGFFFSGLPFLLRFFCSHGFFPKFPPEIAVSR